MPRQNFDLRQFFLLQVTQLIRPTTTWVGRIVKLYTRCRAMLARETIQRSAEARVGLQCGLDKLTRGPGSGAALQEDVLRQQLRLAKELHRPVTVRCRAQVLYSNGGYEVKTERPSPLSDSKGRLLNTDVEEGMLPINGSGSLPQSRTW